MNRRTVRTTVKSLANQGKFRCPECRQLSRHAVSTSLGWTCRPCAAAIKIAQKSEQTDV